MDTEYITDYYKPDDEFLEKLTISIARTNMGEDKGIHLEFLKKDPIIKDEDKL